jgi:hypothetical protein
MKTVEIGGTRYLWRDVLKLRKEQQKAARQPQPTLFPLVEDSRPASEKTAAGRHEEPTLFADRPIRGTA